MNANASITPDQRSDSQQKEIIGRNLLISVFMAEGLEVATPLRDKGIDLIIYDYSKTNNFRARPVQLKAASKTSFSIDRKYAKIPGLLMVYVWYIHEPLSSEIFIMSYTQAEEIGKLHNWINSETWKKEGRYSTPKPSKKLQESLAKYKYRKGKLAQLFER